MYKKLEEEKTVQYYSELLNNTLSIAERRLTKSQSPLWISIVNQLRDIKEKVIVKQIFSDWEDVYERYTLGIIAIREIPENDEMQARLCDIFWGAVHYNELSDNHQ